MSEIKVNSIKGVAASAAAITVNNTDGTCTANITNNLSNRRLTINGDMRIAQRGVLNASGNYTADRFIVSYSGTDEAPTLEQVDVSSGTTPYTLGFRKSSKITNGNQTSGAGTNDTIAISTKLESQDIANSGWNYLSSSSFITLSFWVKSSVAQEFHGFLLTGDGTRKLYSFSLGSLSANTWTKITKTIAGDSNLQFDNDNGEGLNIRIAMFRGTDKTGTLTQNQWATFDSDLRYPNYTSTWYTTNDATFEITGVQLEVSDHATDFEHRSFGQELALCKRYYNRFTAGGAYSRFADGQVQSTDQAEFTFQHPVTMRAAPTYGSGGTLAGWTENSLKSISSIAINDSTVNCCVLTATTSGCTRGYAIDLLANNDTTAYIELISEL